MGWGLISPIFSIFVIEEIVGATLVTVGVVSAFYWLVRSLVQFPIAVALDKMKGEKDDFYVLVLSLLMIGGLSFAMTLVETPFQLYFIQALYGGAFGAYSIAWPSIFSRHMDKGRVAIDWSLDKGLIGLIIAGTSLLGAEVANTIGFDAVFILTGAVSILSALALFAVPKLIIPKSSTSDLEAIIQRIQGKHKLRG